MKKTIALVSTALGTTVMLTACSAGQASPAPTVTVTASQTAPAPAPNNDEAPQAGANGNDNFSSNDDATFLVLLRGSNPWFNGVDDRTLIDLGQSTCSAFDAGMSLQMYAAAAAQSGVTMEQAAQIAAASIVVYCPWNESKVRG